MSATKQSTNLPIHVLAVEKVARSATIEIRKQQHLLDNIEYDPCMPVIKRLKQMQPEALDVPPVRPATPEGPSPRSAPLSSNYWEVQTEDNSGKEVWTRLPQYASDDLEELISDCRDILTSLQSIFGSSPRNQNMI